ncbi:S-layer homology domain-containing protein [Paenibacillus koleovorans]|uniref:S-layer homology domain-containing protein n=1 Tax=Paenibacillus koleovorans TaxID=121608 RepID=UPI000FDAAC24|nr:S-layer homology domain-containing protein [Paenibacillus koleovorans]
MKKRKWTRTAAATLVTLTIMTQPMLATAADTTDPTTSAAPASTSTLTSATDEPTVQPTSLPASVTSAIYGSNPIVAVQGLDSPDRKQVYDMMKLVPASWQLGTVISKEPYAVVTKADSEGATIRVWTGVVAREEDDLLVFWDEIRVDAKGGLVYAATNESNTLKGYFKQPSQTSFRTKSYAGLFPWADIPTDAEAAQKGALPVPSDGLFNVYGIAFQDPDVAISKQMSLVKKETAAIPDQVPTLKKFNEKAIADLPSDAASHWAKDEILDLMQKAIIDGYEDGTIRPDRTLSKAEFVTLLVKSLGLDPALSPVTGYEDMASHWSVPMVAAAQASGLLDKKPVEVNLVPDAAISRIEMVSLINRILQKFSIKGTEHGLTFTDTAGLLAADRTALGAVVSAGIVGGYPDGTFRPAGSLTRAEAFKVISRVLQVLI